MNDLMSFGLHRFWKKYFLLCSNIKKGEKVLDLAAGTGDLAKGISEMKQNKNTIYCVEPNKGMFEEGKKKLRFYKNI